RGAPGAGDLRPVPASAPGLGVPGHEQVGTHSWSRSTPSLPIHGRCSGREEAEGAWIVSGGIADGTDGVDGVGLVGGLVVAVAQHAGEAQRDTTGIAAGALDAVDGDLDDLDRP